MFDNKKPAWQYGLAIAAIVELIHMLMIFVTNMSDVHTAFEFVKKCTAPMVLVNGLAVMTAVLLVSIIGKENRKSIHELKKNLPDFPALAVNLCNHSISGNNRIFMEASDRAVGE